MPRVTDLAAPRAGANVQSSTHRPQRQFPNAGGLGQLRVQAKDVPLLVAEFPARFTLGRGVLKAIPFFAWLLSGALADGLPPSAARAMPSRVRSRISSRSNSAKAPMIESTRRPLGPRCGGRTVWRPESSCRGVQALHVGEHGEEGAPAPVHLADDEDIPGADFPQLAPCGAASEVRG